MSNASELVQRGHPRAALDELQQQVRARPSDSRLRIFLFQLLCILGQWERALQQLQLCGELDAATLAMVSTYRDAVRCEALREAVFDGRATPLVLGEPPEWLALLIQALQCDHQGQTGMSAILRARALDQAPAVAGQLDGCPFEWLADADNRLGPALEVVLGGRYYWVPFGSIARVVFSAPSDLRDLVWAPAQLILLNGGEHVVLVPVRYAGTPVHAGDDEALLMSRRTEWLTLPSAPGGAELFAGIGQRMLLTPVAELGVLDVRELMFKHTVVSDPAEQE